MSTPPNVEADLGWALGAVMRSYLRAVDCVMADVPGGPRGYQVLKAAGRGEPTSQLAMAHQLGVDRTVMTYLLDDLQEAGLVERRPDPADRRARRVGLTEPGHARLCDLEHRLRAAEELLLDPLAPAERDVLRSLLHRLATRAGTGTENLCQVAEEMQDPAPTRRPRHART